LSELKKVPMARYLNPKADLTFKRIFADHPDLLLHFLNSVMPFESGRHIVELEYLPSEMVPDNPGKKFSIVDVRCKDNFKRQFIIEMQGFWQSAFFNRIVFNAGKAYVKQLDSGENYHLLQPVYTLSLLTENFDHKTDRFYHHFQIVNLENSNEIIPCLEFVLVELTEKFRPESVDDRKLMVLWLRFLKEVGENMSALPAEMQENEHIRKAAEICERAAYTPEELARYDGFWDAVRIEKTIKTGALAEGEAIGLEKGEAIGLEKGEAIGLEKGEAIGLEKGEAIGLEKGEAIGLEKGEAIGEQKKAFTVASKALEMGMSIEDVSNLTGLSKQHLENLKHKQ
jgi:predicted transposase/invertase (TIGR01784 family)